MVESEMTSDHSNGSTNRQRSKILSKLKRTGLGVTMIDDERWQVFAEGSTLIDSDIGASLHDLGNVQWFTSFNSLLFSDEQMRCLIDNCQDLRQVCIGDASELSNRSIAALASLHGLAVLELGRLPKPSVVSLWKHCWPKVVDLNLTSSDFHDDHCSSLATAFPGLKRLILRDTSVTCSGLQAIQEMEQLVALDLTGCQIDDGCSHLLANMPSLRLIVLRNTGVTDANAKALGIQKPNCLIVVGDGIDDTFINESQWDEHACVSQFTLR